ncbi:MAG: hypothetical protein QOD24_524 [Solirubrobacteraceae bacterium]|nr:hypothetical protein [Solirubrobacteraceae bacterium]
MIARRCLTPIALAIAVLAASGCGDTSRSQSPFTTTAALPANTTQTATQTATRPARTTPTATTPPPTPAAVAATSKPPKRKHPAAVSAPIRCLRQAGLTNARQRSADRWRGDAGNGEPVVIEGPYDKRTDAKASADTLEGVVLVKASRWYVVTASLRSRLVVAVDRVASCLRRRGR